MLTSELLKNLIVQLYDYKMAHPYLSGEYLDSINEVAVFIGRRLKDVEEVETLEGWHAEMLEKSEARALQHELEKHELERLAVSLGLE
jgi:hypothetical protein